MSRWSRAAALLSVACLTTDAPWKAAFVWWCLLVAAGITDERAKR